MPSVIVDPLLASHNSGGPVIAGVEVKRATSLSEKDEPVRQLVELASGSTRAYDKGVRRVFGVAWAKLTRVEVDQLRGLLAAPFVTFATEVGSDVSVVSTEDGFAADPIPGTYPIRYSGSISLRERDPRT